MNNMTSTSALSKYNGNLYCLNTSMRGSVAHVITRLFVFLTRVQNATRQVGSCNNNHVMTWTGIATVVVCPLDLESRYIGD